MIGVRKSEFVIKTLHPFNIDDMWLYFPNTFNKFDIKNKTFEYCPTMYCYVVLLLYCCTTVVFQGDVEKSLGWKPIPLFDRENYAEIASMQVIYRLSKSCVKAFRCLQGLVYSAQVSNNALYEKPTCKRLNCKISKERLNKQCADILI